MNNKALIYDDNCPLCDAYTGLFVKMKLLDKRIAFSEVDGQDLERIDEWRSRHEIPLLDLGGGETLYGLDSLIEVLSVKIPGLKMIMKVKLIYNSFSWLYHLISYNRRLIVGKNSCHNGFDCAPDFNAKFRKLYILLSLLIATSVFIVFGQMSTVWFTYSMLIVMGLSVLGVYAYTGSSKLRFAFLGQIGTIFIMGALILLPSVFVGFLSSNVIFIVFLLNFVLSVFVMIKEAIRRRYFRELYIYI